MVPITEWSQTGLRSGPRSLSESHGLVARAHCTSRHGGHVRWLRVVSDLDFADDVAFLAEMLSLLVLALEIMDEEARPPCITINWSKIKIQTMLDPAPVGNQVTINGHSVEVVESFGSCGRL